MKGLPNHRNEVSHHPTFPNQAASSLIIRSPTSIESNREWVGLATRPKTFTLINKDLKSLRELSKKFLTPGLAE